MTPPAMTLDQLITYFEGTFETCAVIKSRLAGRGIESREAIRQVGQLQRMVKGYLDALYETKKMIDARDGTAAS